MYRSLVRRARVFEQPRIEFGTQTLRTVIKQAISFKALYCLEVNASERDR